MLITGYYYAVDARLHAYSDAARWALIVEAVGYNPHGGNLFDVLHVFSNSLTCGSAGFDNQHFVPGWTTSRRSRAKRRRTAERCRPSFSS